MKKASLIVLLSILSLKGHCQENQREEARLLLGKMSLDQKIGQMIMPGISGKSLNGANRQMLREVQPGGILLFGVNLASAEKTARFLEDVQRYAVSEGGMPLFVSIDQEGGRVVRITKGVTPFPGAMAVGSAGDETLTYEMARVLGLQLKELGVNMNLAPVLDVNNNPHNPVINNRSFGSSAELVSRMGAAYIRGLQESGCVAVGKHFPGHGDTNKDSHKTLPEIHHDMARLESVEFLPFREAMKSGVEGIMSAHIYFPKILSEKTPATLSRFFLTDLLRTKMKFGGLVITDDMEMAGIPKKGGIGGAAVQSVLAGTDIILLSTWGASVRSIVKALRQAVREGVLTEARIDESVMRILEVKLRYGIITLRHGKANYQKRIPGEEGRKLLARADEICDSLARKSLYARGWSPGLYQSLRGGKGRLYLISHSARLRREMKAAFGSIILGSVKGFYGLRGSRKGDAGDIVLYHLDIVKLPVVRKMVQHARKKGITLCLLSTGNPFPLSEVKNLPPVIYAFSNTGPTMKALARGLRGDFPIKSEIPLDLGFR